MLIALLFATAAEAGAAASTAPVTAPAERAIEWKQKTITLKAGDEPVNVLRIEKPGITESSYAIRGRLSYQDVRGRGYLEMWSHFSDGQAYFSRTLADTGPLSALQGSADQREFMLPFFSKAGQLPVKIEVNIVLPEGGTVTLGKATLIQPAPQVKAAGDWWDARQAGWLGGILGSSLGILGAVIGTLSGLGRARRLVLSLTLTTVIVSAFLLVLGVVALVLKQPYAVWYPLLLCGAIGTIVIGSLLPMIKRRYAEQELRRMTALDAA